MYVVRPLQQLTPIRKSEKLQRALTQIQSDLQTLLTELGKETRHDRLAEWCLAPDYETSTLHLRVELKSGSYQGEFFLVGYEALGRKLWFTPKLPALHFEVLKGQRLSERATEVLTQEFRRMERQEGSIDMDEFAVPKHGKGRLTLIEVRVNLEQNSRKIKANKRTAIFGGDDEKLDGEAELRKVGRLLNAMYPDDLHVAIHREREVADLERWMRLADRRSIVLVGPRQVGKTALIHEWIRHIMATATRAHRRNVWCVSPMRLISGMSFVGEWENRVKAICEHVEKSDSVLYIDDLPGLLTAGQSANSDLNVAQLLKPRMEKRSMRVLAEITPETWRVFRERDRTLADLFHVVPVNEPVEAETLRILVGVARTMEREHDCEFTLDVVPTVYELCRRFASDAAFPGKAAGFIQRLSVKHAGQPCTRNAALEEFRERSGFQISLLDEQLKLDRKSIVQDLQKEVAGQDPVLNAFADVLLKLKTRLNDPRRPLAVFLLLGPTGVGKTQCAKALAKHLFGSADRLLRFDMNEMVDATAVPRLTGRPSEPDGLLTGALRRQPFSVVLLDEIEKAAPEVLDMLLGVLDEGRLSDALGRVADFTSSVILLTSNLGAKESGAKIGFGETTKSEQEASYLRAAESFFRPEFFNRMDRVLPFHELSKQELVTIASRLLSDILRRDGLRQRQCLLAFTFEALERLVELGYHPQLGARALKRVVEREVTQPLAVELAARAPGIPLRMELRVESGRLVLHTRELRPVSRTVFWPKKMSRAELDPQAILQAAKSAFARLESEVNQLSPDGRVALEALTASQERYYHCREQVRRLERLIRATEANLKPRPAHSSRAMTVSRARPLKIIVRQSISGNPQFDRAREAELYKADLSETEPVPEQDIVETPLFATLRELALLELMVSQPHEDQAMALVFRGTGTFSWNVAAVFRDQLEKFLRNHWGTVVEKSESPPDGSGSFQSGLWVEGLNVSRLLEPVIGTWLLTDSEGTLHTLELSLFPCDKVDKILGVPDPPREAPVVMNLLANQDLLMHRTGLLLRRDADAEAFRAFYLPGLPLPQELELIELS